MAQPEIAVSEAAVVSSATVIAVAAAATPKRRFRHGYREGNGGLPELSAQIAPLWHAPIRCRSRKRWPRLWPRREIDARLRRPVPRVGYRPERPPFPFLPLSERCRLTNRRKASSRRLRSRLSFTWSP